jgi:di/tricarboxylate transporter
MIPRGFFYIAMVAVFLALGVGVNLGMEQIRLAQQLLVFSFLFAHFLYPKLILRQSPWKTLLWGMGMIGLVAGLQAGIGWIANLLSPKQNHDYLLLLQKVWVGWPMVLVLSVVTWELSWHLRSKMATKKGLHKRK